MPPCHRLKRLVLGYQQLTSFVLSLDDAEVSPPDGTAQLTRFNCTAINHLHRKAVKFQLDLPYNHDNQTEMDLDACFRPVANFQYLPDELKVREGQIRRRCDSCCCSSSSSSTWVPVRMSWDKS